MEGPRRFPSCWVGIMPGALSNAGILRSSSRKPRNVVTISYKDNQRTECDNALSVHISSCGHYMHVRFGHLYNLPSVSSAAPFSGKSGPHSSYLNASNVSKPLSRFHVTRAEGKSLWSLRLPGCTRTPASWSLSPCSVVFSAL